MLACVDIKLLNKQSLEKEYKNKSVVKPVPGIITMGNTELVLTLLLVQTN